MACVDRAGRPVRHRPAPHAAPTVLTHAHAGRGGAAAPGCMPSTARPCYGFGGMVVSDPMGNLLKCFATLALMVTLVYAPALRGRRATCCTGELFTLTHVRAARHLRDDLGATTSWSIYLGLELLTLSLLRAGRAAPRQRRRHRGGDEVLRARRAGQRLPALRPVDDVRRHRLARHHRGLQGHRQPARSTSQVLVFGLVFIVAGLAFKLGAVPFHMWVPDVYQGAPTAVTLLIGGAPEARGLRDHHPPAGRRPAAAGDRLAADADRAGRRARCWSATSRPSRRPT